MNLAAPAPANAAAKQANEQNQPSKWMKSWWWVSRSTAALLAAAVGASTIWSAFIANKALETSDEARRSATAAEAFAAAAKDHAKTADDTYKLAQKGNVTAEQHADAAKESAAAAKDTAATITQQIGLARAANEIADRSADSASKAATAAEATTKATSESNTIAERTAASQLRAYIGPVMQPRPLLVYSSDLKTYNLELRLRNFGETPAKDVITKSQFTFVPQTIGNHIDPKKLPPMNGAHMTVAPGNEWAILSIEPPQQGLLYVVGRVEYKDVFGGEWYTNFSWVQGFGRGNNTWEMSFTDWGNDAN